MEESDYKKILDNEPYLYNKDEKKLFLNDTLIKLTKHHYEECIEYKKILDAYGVDIDKITDYENIPFLPIRLFKEYELASVDKSTITKTVSSSGTSGQRTSQIYLDRANAFNQSIVLKKIVNDFLGRKRMPMIIMDCKSVLKNRNKFSARGAGILGFSIFASEKIYAFDDEMNLDIDGITDFVEKHQDENIFIFGFTFMIWQHFYKVLKSKNIKVNLSKGILIHGGGWKKLESEKVNSKEYQKALESVSGIQKVYEYYGMAEQTGTIYMACEHGHLHTSVFSDVIIRRPDDFKKAEIGEKGLIQVLSVLPFSYPGHSILTEDEGILKGEDDCPCGRKGKYFSVTGRVKNAEIRGCSDTYATELK